MTSYVRHYVTNGRDILPQYYRPIMFYIFPQYLLFLVRHLTTCLEYWRWHVKQISNLPTYLVLVLGHSISSNEKQHNYCCMSDIEAETIDYSNPKPTMNQVSPPSHFRLGILPNEEPAGKKKLPTNTTTHHHQSLCYMSVAWFYLEWEVAKIFVGASHTATCLFSLFDEKLWQDHLQRRKRFTLYDLLRAILYSRENGLQIRTTGS